MQETSEREISFHTSNCGECVHGPVCRFRAEYERAKNEKTFSSFDGPFSYSITCTEFRKSAPVFRETNFA